MGFLLFRVRMVGLSARIMNLFRAKFKLILFLTFLEGLESGPSCGVTAALGNLPPTWLPINSIMPCIVKISRF